MSGAPVADGREQLRLGILGYGEVGHGLASGLRKEGLTSIAAFQRLPHSTLTLERAQVSGVRLVQSVQELAECCDVVIAATQGSQSLVVAQAIAPALRPHHCYVDLASASPGTKRAVGEVLASSGAAFADGVIEGSPLEVEHRFPILASGPGAQRFADLMTPWNMRISVIGEVAGQAATIKGLRHVLMKGQIALLIECLRAARRAGVDREVLASVAEWYDGLPYLQNAGRLLRTTTVHATRRAEEAQTACDILTELSVDPVMTNSTVTILKQIAALDLREHTGGVPPDTLDAALDLIERHWKL